MKFYSDHVHASPVEVTSSYVGLTLKTAMKSVFANVICQTPSKTQTDKNTNGQMPGIEFGAFQP